MPVAQGVFDALGGKRGLGGTCLSVCCLLVVGCVPQEAGQPGLWSLLCLT